MAGMTGGWGLDGEGMPERSVGTARASDKAHLARHSVYPFQFNISHCPYLAMF